MSRIPKKKSSMPLPIVPGAEVGPVAAAQESEEIPMAVVEADPAKEPDYVDAKKPVPKAPKVKEAKKGPFKVQALRVGFYKQRRRKVGDQFMVDKEEQLGTWMKVLE